MAQLKDGTRIYGDATVDQTLTVGNISITGNLIVSGTTTSVDTTVTRVVDPIFEIGGGIDGAALTSSDGLDRGLLMHYYASSAPVDAFMGWSPTDGEFQFGEAVTETSGLITVGTYGNLRANVFFGDGGGLSNIVGQNVTGTVASATTATKAGTVTANAQGNITSVGTLTGLTIDGGNLNVVNASIVTSGSISGNGDLTVGIASGAGANLATANVYGNLNVTGNISGQFTGTVAAKGANTEVQFNDNGSQNATSGFTFTKSSNTVVIGTSITLAGDDGVANIGSQINFTDGAKVGNIQGAGKGIDLYGDASYDYVQLNWDNQNYVFADGSQVAMTTSSGGPTYIAKLTDDGVFTIPGNLQTDTGNFAVNEDGNVNASGYGSFADVYDTNLTQNQVVFPGTGGKLGGSAGLTYSSNTLNANNFATTGNASITGNITTKFTGGNLLATDNGGNVVDSEVSLSGSALGVGNITVTNNTQTSNLRITNLSTPGALLFTNDINGNVTENADLYYYSNALHANNFTTTGYANAANAVISSLQSTQIVYATTGGEVVGDNDFTYSDTTKTVTANNFSATDKITAIGNVQGGNIIADNLGATEVVYSGTGGVLRSNSTFYYTSSTSTLTVDNITGTTQISSGNVKATNLNNHAVVIADSTGKLLDDTGNNFAYYTSNTTLSVETIKAGNIYANSGTIGASLLTGTLTTASQPNVTSVGTLNSVAVTGNANVGGLITDNLYYTNGDPWDLQQAAGSNNYVQYNSDDNFAASSNFTFDPTAVSSTGKLTVTGQVDTGLVTATTGNITTINSTNIFATTGNITTVNATTVVATTGNITTINVTDIEALGNANITGYLKAGDTTITGNLTVSGTTTSVNTTVSQLSDPIIELGAGANGAPLTMDDGMDRGLVMHTYSIGNAVDVFMGYKDDADEFILAKNVTVSNNVVDYGTTDSQKLANLADLRLGNIYAYNANFGGTVFSNGNITLGSGSFVNGNVNGNISGTITVTGGAGAVQFANAANSLTSSTNFNFNDSTVTLTVGDGTTTGNVIANLVTGTLTTAAQPNITSVGTLGNLNVGTTLDIATGTVVANTGGIYTDGYYYANGDQIDFQTAAGTDYQIQFHKYGANDLDASANLTFDPAQGNLTVNGNIITGTGSGGNITGADYVTANYFTGTLTTAAQPNITSVGTLANLTVAAAGIGNITADNIDVVSGGRIGSSGMYLYGDGSNISGVIASSANAETLTGTYINASVTGSSLTSVGTLANLTVSGAGGSGIITADSVYANSGIVSGMYLYGDGSNISSITGANVTGYVPNANVANVAYDVSGSNISGTTLNANVVTSSLTSVGTLGNLTVTGDITSTTGNVLAGNIGNASTTLYGNGYNITGVTASSIDANNLTGTTLASGVTSSSLTSVGTLTSLAVSGTTNLGAVGNVTITGGTSGQYLQTDGAGVLTWSTIDLSMIDNGNSNVAVANNGNVTVGINGTASVITVATTGLTVTGIINASGNIVGNNITSNNFLTVSGTDDATSAITGAITTAGGISAQGNIYTGHAIGFANTPGSNTSSAAFIQYNSAAGSLDFIFN
jgi:hypothetical protein